MTKWTINLCFCQLANIDSSVAADTQRDWPAHRDASAWTDQWMETRGSSWQEHELKVLLAQCLTALFLTNVPAKQRWLKIQYEANTSPENWSSALNVAPPRKIWRPLPGIASQESLLAAENSQHLASSSQNVRGLSLPPVEFEKHVGPSQHNHLDTIALPSRCSGSPRGVVAGRERSLKVKITLPNQSCAPWEILRMKSPMKQFHCAPWVVVYCWLGF